MSQNNIPAQNAELPNNQPAKSDLILIGSPVQLKSNRNLRRGSSLVKMTLEDNSDETATKSERAEMSEKFRKSIDNTYRHSLESISEYKPKSVSPSPLHPSLEFNLESPTSDCTSDCAIRSADSAKDTTDRTYVNSTSSYLSWIESVSADCSASVSLSETDCPDKSGEWYNFWSNYNSSRNEYFSSPYLCPSNSGENLSVDSNGSANRNRSVCGAVSFTLEEVNEAVHHAERLLEILRSGLQRSESENVSGKHDQDSQNVDSPNSNLLTCINYIWLQEKRKDETYSLKSEKSEKNKSIKPLGANNCINILLGQTGVADMLKRVINKKREVIMPQENDTRKNSISDWSVFSASKD